MRRITFDTVIFILWAIAVIAPLTIGIIFGNITIAVIGELFAVAMAVGILKN